MPDKKQQKISILMTTSTLNRWNQDNELSIVFDIAAHLKKYKNIQITILAPHFFGAKKEEVAAGVRIFRFQYFFARLQTLCYQGGMLPNIKRNKLNIFLLPFFAFFHLLALHQAIRKIRPQIIHAHWLMPQGFLALLYKKVFRQDFKIICTSHGIDVFSLRGKCFVCLKQWLVKNLDGLTAVSEALKSELIRNYKADKVRVIHNAVNIENFTPETRQRNNIPRPALIFVGRLVEKKGVEYIIKAMPQIIKSYPACHLEIIGDGPKKQSLQKLSQTVSSESNIKFLGSVSHNNIPKYLAASDIFIGPSIVAKNLDTEGFGVVFIEAMACGLPIITTAVGGITDIIKNNENGFIVETKNEQAIADVVIKLLRDESLRVRLGQAGRKTVEEKFTWRSITDKYYECYLCHSERSEESRG
ncbi:glycosyltransferase family 4 protein [Candidatus Parcubacteria bacterium]|nr:glycosyltransferase family 4 protein [Candidatus Parcubacteria bacterium]